ncbi:EamA-like transporter family [Seminavis robusta]|uniref:EamA-like transporter family n=1 Tax=Seminavis robusta TaxID=568900 RepID=A0A9N8DUG3_9STRA|nr:EamA-like transporter family [Seminavis robusta]|eukprot:Sro380_g130640.1 EamA-like transporter family (398) ;mRNA; r:27140-28333
MAPQPPQDEEQQPLLTSGSHDSATLKSYDTAVSTSSSSGDHGNDDDAVWEPLAASSSLELPEHEQHSSGPKTTGGGYSSMITKGHVLLLIVAILYGSLNVALRGVYAQPDPPKASALSTIRGWMAVLCFAPFLLHQRHQPQQPQQPTSTATSNSNNNNGLWKVALELAIWNFGAQALVNVGLLYIPSARAAFFTQLSVVMTPGLSALAGHKLHRNVGMACVFALIGLVLLCKQHNSDSDNDSPGSFTLGFGDILTLCGALSWSTYIYRLSAVGGHYNDVHLQALKNIMLASLYTIWCLVEFFWTGGENPWMGWSSSILAWVFLFYSALGPGCVADVLQQQGQATVTATVSNIILSLEPVFTAIFARLLLGEYTSGMEKLGGCMILLAAIVATLGQEE